MVAANVRETILPLIKQKKVPATIIPLKDLIRVSILSVVWIEIAGAKNTKPSGNSMIFLQIFDEA
ncbi:MAG: hypothetical protein ABJC04_11170 [Verrucomicrobiota bacterium]